MNCPYCQSELYEAQTFCHNCGEQVISEEQQQSEPAKKGKTTKQLSIWILVAMLLISIGGVFFLVAPSDPKQQAMYWDIISEFIYFVIGIGVLIGIAAYTDWRLVFDILYALGPGKTITLFMIIFLVAIFSFQGEHKFDWNDALVICQSAMTKSSRDPGTANIPPVPNQGKGNAYHFSWGVNTEYARMRNGFGLEVPVTADCVVDARNQTIALLQVDGDTIIKNY
jgi:hypothetical protein